MVFHGSSHLFKIKGHESIRPYIHLAYVINCNQTITAILLTHAVALDLSKSSKASNEVGAKAVIALLKKLQDWNQGQIQN